MCAHTSEAVTADAQQLVQCAASAALEHEIRLMTRLCVPLSSAALANNLRACYFFVLGRYHAQAAQMKATADVQRQLTASLRHQFEQLTQWAQEENWHAHALQLTQKCNDFLDAARDTLVKDMLFSRQIAAIALSASSSSSSPASSPRQSRTPSSDDCSSTSSTSSFEDSQWHMSNIAILHATSLSMIEDRVLHTVRASYSQYDGDQEFQRRSLTFVSDMAAVVAQRVWDRLDLVLQLADRRQSQMVTVLQNHFARLEEAFTLFISRHCPFGCVGLDADVNSEIITASDQFLVQERLTYPEIVKSLMAKTAAPWAEDEAQGLGSLVDEYMVRKDFLQLHYDSAVRQWRTKASCIHREKIATAEKVAADGLHHVVHQCLSDPGLVLHHILLTLSSSYSASSSACNSLFFCACTTETCRICGHGAVSASKDNFVALLREDLETAGAPAPVPLAERRIKLQQSSYLVNEKAHVQQFSDAVGPLADAVVKAVLEPGIVFARRAPASLGRTLRSGVDAEIKLLTDHYMDIVRAVGEQQARELKDMQSAVAFHMHYHHDRQTESSSAVMGNVAV